jgi:hypothetical protein
MELHGGNVMLIPSGLDYWLYHHPIVAALSVMAAVVVAGVTVTLFIVLISLIY